MRFLVCFLSLLAAAAVSQTGGGHVSEDVECELEREYDASSLWLLQRNARQVASIVSSRAEAAASDDGIGAKQNRSWLYSSLGEMLAPVQLSLSSVSSRVNSVFMNETRSRGQEFVLIILPLLLLVVLCGLCILHKRGEVVESVWKAPPRTASLQAASPMTTSSSFGNQTPALSPLVPTLRMPVQQRPKSSACLLFPTMAADVRTRDRSFNVYWGSLDAPWFRADLRGGKLDLVEIGIGSSLAASINLSASAGASADGVSAWIVSNQQLKATTRGLAYRSAKDDRKVRARNAMASWGSTVYGTNLGDGWLQVGDWYLPMTVDGSRTIIEAPSQKPPPTPASGLQITRGDGSLFASLRPLAGGQFMIMRNGAITAIISIGTSGFLVEAELANGRRVATVAKDQVRMPSGEMMLELIVEPQMDAVIMLVSAIAALRQLPAHDE